MSKLQPLLASVHNDNNYDVLMFLQGKSAHSEVADVLVEAAVPLGDVQLYSSDPASYGCIVLKRRTWCSLLRMECPRLDFASTKHSRGVPWRPGA